MFGFKRKPKNPMVVAVKKFNKIQEPFFKAYFRFVGIIDRIQVSHLADDALTAKEIEALLVNDLAKLYEVFDNKTIYHYSVRLRERLQPLRNSGLHLPDKWHHECPFQIGNFIFVLSWNRDSFDDRVLRVISIMVQYPDGRSRFLYGCKDQSDTPDWVNSEYSNGPWMLDLVAEMQTFIDLVDRFGAAHKQLIHTKKVQVSERLKQTADAEVNNAFNEYHEFVIKEWNGEK